MISIRILVFIDNNNEQQSERIRIRKTKKEERNIT